VDAALQRRGQVVREWMAQRYNKRHAVHIFAVGDMVSVGIPREDRAKTDNKLAICKSYCKTTARAPPTINQVWYHGILVNVYPTKDLQPATDLMGLEDDTLWYKICMEVSKNSEGRVSYVN